MTLETAKRIIEEGLQSKEAEAVVRGGMNICDVLPDGRRRYSWIKVLPTKTDAESSIDAALEKNKKKPRKPVAEPKPQVKAESPAPANQSPKKEAVTQLVQPTFVERLKKKTKDFWHELDSIVIE
jgi:hypothetical protein